MQRSSSFISFLQENLHFVFSNNNASSRRKSVSYFFACSLDARNCEEVAVNISKKEENHDS